MTEAYSTKEVSEQTGIPVSRLQFWVREGILNPSCSGEGRRRRLSWNDQDIRDAQRLSNGKGKTSALLALLDRAEPLKDRPRLAGELIAVGNDGARIFSPDTTLGEVKRKLGKFVLLIA
ncbi:hypothetical protein AMJ71_08530 [candidate division TA06 bacterium SM1_40]|uniref:HTH merR-type domain-containing protein n=1 Tax=candidate division TA06 bacterium SM1_40 TaxID=1703773 RepID=A0A0S8JH37_UNCT6|nr:MAG: hypothetical protein AMJ71_08530 [candidate division TA06 bacterium SM1_40]